MVCPSEMCARHRVSFLLFLLLVSANVLAQVSTEVREEYKAGRLETLLAASPNADVETKELGRFTASTSGMFTAIVATDTTINARVGGLKVEFEGQGFTNTVYLDEDCIERLQRSVRSLERHQRFAAEHVKDISTSELATPQGILAYNDYNNTVLSDGRTQRAAILYVGYHGYERGFGVYFASPFAKGHDSGQFWYPNASLTQFSQILSDAQSFFRSKN